MKNQDTYVIIPVYNEATVIGSVLTLVQKHYDKIVCVDDGSHDDSVKIMKNAGVHVVCHPINLGAGAATQTGVEYALKDRDTKYFITFDADGQHHIEDAIKMVQHLKKQKLDIVFGSRFLGQIENISHAKSAFLKIAKIFSKFDSGVELSDPHIGLRAFNRKFATNLKLTMPDFSHASELLHRVKEGNYAYAEIPVKVTYSDYSKAKGQPMLNSINITFDLLLHRITKK